MPPHVGAIVVIEVASGHVLAARNLPLAATLRAAPGSSIKPFVLQFALEQRAISSEERHYCRRTLTIGGKRMDCTHPAAPASLSAQEALAYSCNSYFAALATRLDGAQLADYLRGLGFTSTTGLASQETRGAVRAPQTAEQIQLLALGEDGIEITPLELLAAYRQLAIGQKTAAPAVKLGLEGSVEYGMAHAAAVRQLHLAGKTGTASQPGRASTHGWFVGYAPAEQPEIALVVYLAHGRGADAATIAQRVFSAYAAPRGNR